MGAAGAMKAMKSKAKRVTVISGGKEKTASGMTKAKLMKNSRGKIVSKARSAASKKRFATGLGLWTAAVKTARKALNLKGFVAINGKTAEGKAVNAKARSIYAKEA